MLDYLGLLVNECIHSMQQHGGRAGRGREGCAMLRNLAQCTTRLARWVNVVCSGAEAVQRVMLLHAGVWCSVCCTRLLQEFRFGFIDSDN
jgi:hypothetical protein